MTISTYLCTECGYEGIFDTDIGNTIKCGRCGKEIGLWKNPDAETTATQKTATHPLTKDELHVINILLGEGGQKPGSFTTALIEAIAKADMTNFAKLSSVYPALCAAVKSYQQGDLWERWMRIEGRLCECKAPGFSVSFPTICPTCNKPHRSDDTGTQADILPVVHYMEFTCERFSAAKEDKFSSYLSKVTCPTCKQKIEKKWSGE